MHIRFTPKIDLLSLTWVFLVLFLSAPALGQVVYEEIKLLAEDGEAGDELGYSVDVHNGIIAAGALFDDDNGTMSGSAYLFDASTGSQLFKLLPDDGEADDQFGLSVAIQNGMVAVGANGDDDNGNHAGAVYLFDASTGAQLLKFIPDDHGNWASVGWSVAIDDGVVATGAINDSDVASYAGSAYLFDAATGAQLHKLEPDDLAASDGFGWSIDIAGGIVAVGSPRDDDNGGESGSAYLFDATTGAQLLKLLPEGGAGSNEFGWSIAIGDGIVVVGARGYLFDMGAVYIFDLSTGVQIARLTAEDAAYYSDFGWSVAVDNGVIAVGATEYDGSTDNTGSAYLFRAATGAQLAKLMPMDGGGNNYNFGSAVAIDGDVAVVGADRDGENGWPAGAAYIYDISFTPVAISSFSAAVRGAGVELAWGIAADEPFEGFHLFRSEDGGVDMRVNDSILASHVRGFVDDTVRPGRRYSYQLVAVGAESGDVRSHRADVELEPMLVRAALRQNSPNPFNPTTTIRFMVAEQGPVTISIYGLDGTKIRTLVDRVYSPGQHSTMWDGRNSSGGRVASGVYYYRMLIDQVVHTKKLTLLK